MAFIACVVAPVSHLEHLSLGSIPIPGLTIDAINNAVGMPVTLNFTKCVVGQVTHSFVDNNQWIVKVNVTDASLLQAFPFYLTTGIEINIVHDKSDNPRGIAKLTELSLVRQSKNPGAMPIKFYHHL